MSGLETLPGQTQRALAMLSERPYQVLMLDIPRGMWSAAAPPPLLGAGQYIQVQHSLSCNWGLEDLERLQFEGVCLTEAWLRANENTPVLAQLALLSLAQPIFLMVPDSTNAVDPRLPLSALVRPLSWHIDQAHVVGDRLLQALKDARLRRQWLEALGGRQTTSQVLRWLPRVCPSPEGFVVDPETFHHNVVSMIRQVLQSRVPISTMMVQLRWRNGATPALPPHLWMRVEDCLNRSLRDSDVLGCLGDGTYAAVLPGQTPEEALVPGQRLASLDWSQVVPRGEGELVATVGVAGCQMAFDGSYDFFSQADFAARWPASPGTAQIFEPSETALTPRWWSPIAGAKHFDIRARLWELLPGLFAVPFSDRQFERHLAVICDLVGSESSEQGRKMARIADDLAQALGVSIMPRRVLWRACRLHDVARRLDVSKAEGEADDPSHHWVTTTCQFLEPVLGLKQERMVLTDAYRGHLRPSYTPLDRHNELYLCSRIFEVVDNFFELVDAHGATRSLDEIGESMLDGAHWRFDSLVVRTFVEWLRCEGEEFFP